MSKKNLLTYKILRKDQLTNEDKRKMWGVFCKYYDDTSEDIFNRDLKNKTHVILLIGKVDREIKGFSTQVVFEKKINGENARVIYSGDTILMKEFWGQGTLQSAFSVFAIKLMFERPFSPVYWFLISKGYKTYLLMANNFKYCWPIHSQETPPEIFKAIGEMATELFPRDYEKGKSIIKFKGVHDHLKKDVAPITEEELKNPHIRYFQTMNPDWENGDELLCMSRFDWPIHLRVGLKTGLKVIKKILNVERPK